MFSNNDLCHTRESHFIKSNFLVLRNPYFGLLVDFLQVAKKKHWLHRHQTYGLKRFDIFMTPFNTEKNECSKLPQQCWQSTH